MCLRLSSLPTWTGVMALSWAGHGKLPEVWKNPRHKERHHHSQPTLPSCHYIACGPSQCLPHPRSPTHHLSPTHSTLVNTLLSPTLCPTHPPPSSHSTFCPHTIFLPTQSSVHPSLSPYTTTPCVPPSAPSTAQCLTLLNINILIAPPNIDIFFFFYSATLLGLLEPWRWRK
jgi:hypothetical protein